MKTGASLHKTNNGIISYITSSFGLGTQKSASWLSVMALYLIYFSEQCNWRDILIHLYNDHFQTLFFDKATGRTINLVLGDETNCDRDYCL